jgi:translation initiation factor 4A
MQEAIIAIGSFMSIKCHACIGGNRAFPDSPQVVVGTPGRIQGMVQKGFFQNNGLKIIVLNEADEMLSRGFDEQIYDIFQLLPPAQTILFSATIPQDVLQITTKLMGDPVRIVAKEDKPLKGIKQFYITAGGEESKLHALSNLLSTLTQTTRTIVFGNTRRKVEELAKKLSVHGLAISAMHGDMDAVQRAGIIEDFRSGSSRVLIATNLLARGLDVQSVSLVINYDLPGKIEDYIHRLCRKGITINFISGDEDPTMHEFEQFYHTEMEEMPANVGDLI